MGREKADVPKAELDTHLTDPQALESNASTIQLKKKKQKKEKKKKRNHSEIDTENEQNENKDVKLVENPSVDQTVNFDDDQKSKKKKRKKKNRDQKNESKNVEQSSVNEEPKIESNTKSANSSEITDSKRALKKRKKEGKSKNSSSEQKIKNEEDKEKEQADTKPDSAMNEVSDKPEQKSSPSKEGSGQALDEEEDIPHEEERLKRTLFVGNVSQTVTRKEIRKLFQQHGEIESVRIRNVIPVNPKIPKKAALLSNRLAKFADSFVVYVVFKEQPNLESVMREACEKRNMTIFMEKHLRVMPAIQDRAGPRRQSIFVGNLPFDCSEEELILAFEPIANEVGARIVNVRVNKDRDTGVGRGVGYVSFDDDIGVQASLNNVGKISIRNRMVRIERALKTKNMKSKSYKAKKNQHFGKQRGVKRNRNTRNQT